MKFLELSPHLIVIFLTMLIKSEVVELKFPDYQNAVDVSSHQGKIDWAKVRNAGIFHVIMRATEGAAFQDVTFLYNWEMANQNKIKTSVYHYFRALAKPEDQVKNIIKTLNLTTFNKNEDLLAIDVEQNGNEMATPSEIANNLYSFLKYLRDHNFSKLFIYSSYNFWEYHVKWEMFDFSTYPLWLAWYEDKFDVQPKLPTTWKNVGWTFWQYCNLGKVDGIETYVDLDFCKTKI